MTTRSTGDLKKFENFENKFSFLMLQFVKSWMNKGYAKDKLQIVNNLEFYCSLPCFKRKEKKKCISLGYTWKRKSKTHNS
jgi:hypothetical protein